MEFECCKKQRLLDTGYIDGRTVRHCAHCNASWEFVDTAKALMHLSDAMEKLRLKKEKLFKEWAK